MGEEADESLAQGHGICWCGFLLGCQEACHCSEVGVKPCCVGASNAKTSVSLTLTLMSSHPEACLSMKEYKIHAGFCL